MTPSSFPFASLIAMLALIIGCSLAARQLASIAKPAPALSHIERTPIPRVTLLAPLAMPESSDSTPQAWQIEYFAGLEPQLAATSQSTIDSPWFNENDNWLREAVARQPPIQEGHYRIRITGRMAITTPTMGLSLNADNGYRLRWTDSLGKTQELNDLAPNVTLDRPILVTAEPGVYLFEAEILNYGGGCGFELKAKLGAFNLLSPLPPVGLRPKGG